jgi:hypothetical protein
MFTFCHFLNSVNPSRLRQLAEQAGFFVILKALQAKHLIANLEIISQASSISLNPTLFSQ